LNTLRIFENRGMRRMFGTKKEEAMGFEENFYNEELHNLCSQPHIRMIKSRNMN
jgi:hypothetical protein